MEISLAAETLFHVGPVAVTNSLLSALIIASIISIITVVAGQNLSVERPGKFQLFLEMLLSGLSNMSKTILDRNYSPKLFAFLFTFFFFIILSNWFGLLPFVGPLVKVHSEEEVQTSQAQAGKVQAEVPKEEEHSEEVSFKSCLKERDCILTTEGIKRTEAFPLFRAPTSDVSATLALALISVVATNILGIAALGRSYFTKYISFKDPISFFVGVLEGVSELGKIISFTFRLFGNVFAGEVLILVMTSISFGLATLPFLLLEIFVGFIQAFVFFMLTMVFMSLAMTSHSKH